MWASFGNGSQNWGWDNLSCGWVCCLRICWGFEWGLESAGLDPNPDRLMPRDLNMTVPTEQYGMISNGTTNSRRWRACIWKMGFSILTSIIPYSAFSNIYWSRIFGKMFIEVIKKTSIPTLLSSPSRTRSDFKPNTGIKPRAFSQHLLKVQLKHLQYGIWSIVALGSNTSPECPRQGFSTWWFSL